MESINNKIRRALKGEQDALEFIHQHYLYIGDKFYETNKDKISKEELYSIIEQAINEFCNIETKLSLSLYLYKKIGCELQKNKEASIDVKKTVSLACQGDVSARNDLIKHYTKIVTEKAKNYDYMEYEDLVQFGMIKLIEYIDILIEEHQNNEFFTNGIGRAIDIYFNRTLRRKVELCNVPLSYMENDLDNFKFEHEFASIVNNLTTNEVRREIIKQYFLEGKTFSSIGENYNMSHENVRRIIKLVQPQLKKVYLK